MNANFALPETLALFAAALTDDGARAALLDRLDGPPQRNAKRFEAYRRNVLGNWVAALESAYPVVRRLVGDVFFHEAARCFARATPSLSGDLNEYGAGFADFLAGYPHAAPLPYLPDVARLEWQVQASYFAADADPFDFTAFAASLAALPAARHGDVRCRFAPAFATLAADTPAPAIWLAHQDAESDDIAPLTLTPGPHYAWVVRPGGRVRVVAVDAAAAGFAGELHRGAPLGAAIEAALVHDPAFAVDAALRRLIDTDALVAIFLEPAIPPGDTP